MRFFGSFPIVNKLLSIECLIFALEDIPCDLLFANVILFLTKVDSDLTQRFLLYNFILFLFWLDLFIIRVKVVFFFLFFNHFIIFIEY